MTAVHATAAETRTILVANVGSTSFKFKLYEVPKRRMLARGHLDRIGTARTGIQISVGGARILDETRAVADYTEAIRIVLRALTSSENAPFASLSELHGVAFKCVCALGLDFSKGTAFLLDQDALHAMEKAVFIAPAHNPPYLQAIRTFERLAPDIPRIGLFEPTFHRTIPERAYRYAVPGHWEAEWKIRRYGYHGASHWYISERTAEVLGVDPRGLRMISCHLGGSSSICAIKHGRSMDTSMGFTPQSGLPNATRNGDMDPFIPLYLMREKSLGMDAVREALSQEGGLKGLSGISGDMRDIWRAVDQGDRNARLAVDVFAYAVQKYIGAYLVALEGLDAITFTGGIGERDARFRKTVLEKLRCIGVVLDDAANATHNDRISAPDSKIACLALETDEEWIVAREAAKCLS